MINTLQNYYGTVIRANRDLYAMKKGIAAIIFHCSEFLTNGEPDDEKRHQYCPQDTWCKYQKNKLFGGLLNYKSKINIPEATRDIIQPIFSLTDLGNDDLKKCLHGKT